MNTVTIVYPDTPKGEVYQIPAADQAHFVATNNRALYLAAGDNTENVSVMMGNRTQPRTTANGLVYDEGGWLEHLIMVTYASGRKMAIGAIQRSPEAESEFHS